MRKVSSPFLKSSTARLSMSNRKSLARPTATCSDQKKHVDYSTWLTLWPTIHIETIQCTIHANHSRTPQGGHGTRHGYHRERIWTTKHITNYPVSACGSRFPNQNNMSQVHHKRKLQHMATTHSQKRQQTFSWGGGDSTRPHAQPTPMREINQGQDQNKERRGGEKGRTKKSTNPYTTQTIRHPHQGTRYQWQHVHRSNWKVSTYIQLRKPIRDDSLTCWQQLHMGGTYERSNGGRDDTSVITSSH